jgi:HEAT repeat protein
LKILAGRPIRNKRAIAALVRALADPFPGIPGDAANALGKVGKAAVPALTECLAHPKADVRLYAMSALRDIGPKAAAAVPHLIEKIPDTGRYNPRWAIWALEAIEPQGSPLVTSALVNALTTAEPVSRALAAAALIRFGKNTPVAFAVLTAALRSADEDTQRQAAYALEDVAAKIEGIVPFLSELLRQREPPLRCCAVRALGRIHSAEAVALLVSALQGDDKALRWIAAGALGRLGPDAASALSPLNEALEDPEPLVRQEAAKALALIQR